MMTLKVRNNILIDTIISKIQKCCPDAVDLIGIVGSFYKGVPHEKSDLDLCIVINDDKAKSITECFIIDDVGFDFYCTSWKQLEKMAEYNDPYATKLKGMELVYHRDSNAIKRYEALCHKLEEKLLAELTSNDIDKIEAFINESKLSYADLMISKSYGEGRYAVGKMIYDIELAMYMYNRKLIMKSTKDIVQEVRNLPNLPSDFARIHEDVIQSNTLESLKENATKLMTAVIDFVEKMGNSIRIKKELKETDLKGIYEEITSNWKNKMNLATKSNNAYLSLSSATACQWLYTELANKYLMDEIWIFDNSEPDNLIEGVKSFNKGLELIEEHYRGLDMQVKRYKTIDDFVNTYLES